MYFHLPDKRIDQREWDFFKNKRRTWNLGNR